MSERISSRSGDVAGGTVHRTAGSRVVTGDPGRAGSRSACGSPACGEARGGGLAGTGAVDLGRGLRRVADRRRHRGRGAGWRPGRQGAAGADDHHARRARRLVSGPGRAPRPERGSQPASSPSTASGGPSRCAASAATPSSCRTSRSGSNTVQAARRGDRRERRAPRGPPEDDPRRLARRDLVGPLRRRALRLRQPVRRALDHPPGQEGRPDQFWTSPPPCKPPPTRSPPSPRRRRDDDDDDDDAMPSGQPALASDDEAPTAPAPAPTPAVPVQVASPEPPRHRSPRRPKPSRSASNATARSSEWMSQKPRRRWRR